MEFEVSEYETFTIEPESLSIGKLNSVVRCLRECIYQEKLKNQELQNKLYKTR